MVDRTTYGALIRSAICIQLTAVTVTFIIGDGVLVKRGRSIDRDLCSGIHRVWHTFVRSAPGLCSRSPTSLKRHRTKDCSLIPEVRRQRRLA